MVIYKHLNKQPKYLSEGISTALISAESWKRRADIINILQILLLSMAGQYIKEEKHKKNDHVSETTSVDNSITM